MDNPGEVSIRLLWLRLVVVVRLRVVVEVVVRLRVVVEVVVRSRVVVVVREKMNTVNIVFSPQEIWRAWTSVRTSS